MKKGYTFSKQERLCGTIQVDRLFAEGERRIAVFPIRLVWLLTDDTEGIRILVSAPKRLFKHAVDRNRMKRLVREAYRLNKHILWEALEGKDERLVLAFVCITDSLPSFSMVQKSVKKALVRIAERQ